MRFFLMVFFNVFCFAYAVDGCVFRDRWFGWFAVGGGHCGAGR